MAAGTIEPLTPSDSLHETWVTAAGCKSPTFMARFDSLFTRMLTALGVLEAMVIFIQFLGAGGPVSYMGALYATGVELRTV